MRKAKAVKARGRVEDEIKKLSSKTQKKFRAAEAHVKSRPLSKNISNETHSVAEAAFYRLSGDIRHALRERYASKGWSYADWLEKGPDKYAKRARRTSTPTQAIRVGDTSPAKDKRIAKDIRSALASAPKPPKNPYAALMHPMVIVPDSATEKTIIADAGTIVRLADQATLYRDRLSPITHRADEILVHYGKAKTPLLGWITQRIDAKKSMRPSRGPTFLVMTKDEGSLSAWEQLRLKVGRARRSDETMWVVRWLAEHGDKFPRDIREVIREFGGKPIKNEGSDVRYAKLSSLILNTEIDMASLKKEKGKKGKRNKKAKVREDADVKSSKKTNKKTNKKVSGKKARMDSEDRITSKYDEHIVKRLVKENPRRAGSKNAKIWDKLKKGMTVSEFSAKGGSRAAVGYYLRSGWIKLLKPRDGDDD